LLINLEVIDCVGAYVDTVEVLRKVGIFAKSHIWFHNVSPFFIKLMSSQDPGEKAYHHMTTES